MAKPIRRHNRAYSGGFPLAAGDRDYAQDIFRDQAYQEALTGIAYNDLTQQTAPYVINGLVAAQGAGHTMDVSAGKAVVPFTVTIPDTVAAWTVPPTTTTANIDMVVDYAGVSGASLAGTVTDGATPNYVKLAYTETNGNTRTRAKKAGSYAYEVYDAVTLSIDDTAPSATEITLLTFTTDGATVTVTDNGDTRTGSPYHMQDAVVYSQATFNDCIVRVAANQYKIRDDIQSLYCATLSGGYLMTGGTSPLSGGDGWGYIETNNCAQVIFESGATMHMGNERGYLEVDTDDCYLLNVNIIGTGTVASAILQSFLLNANRASFNNCKSSVRLSTGNFDVFQGSGTAAHNTSSEYYGCSCEQIEASGGHITGFRDCMNMVNCQVVDIEGTGGAVSTYGFKDCIRLTNCYIIELDSSGLNCMGFDGCDNITGCRAEDIDSSTPLAYGFNTCDNISGCIAFDIDSAADDAVGFNSCNNISDCKANQIDHSGSVAGKDAYGFNSCEQVSACIVSDVDTNGAAGSASGFEACEKIAGSYATTCDIGFNTCVRISACESSSNSIHGFSNCDEISSSFADNNTTNGFSNCERITCSLSTNNGGTGFIACVQLNANRSNANTAAQYGASFADFGGTQAVADTAVGGYNG